MTIIILYPMQCYCLYRELAVIVVKLRFSYKCILFIKSTYCIKTDVMMTWGPRDLGVKWKFLELSREDFM